ncbi:hypothetical protein DV735_g1898, partial [Chaetothyriales sp. CBS 134920]
MPPTAPTSSFLSLKHALSLPLPLAANSHSSPPLLAKRQIYVLAIPTTYYGLDSGPSPGVVVAIMLGSIAGFLLAGWVLLLAVRVYSSGGGGVFEKETIIRTHRRTTVARSRSRSRSSHRRRRTTIVEEAVVAGSHVSNDEIIVEEEPEDVVEVIEDPSPDRRESRRESRVRRSGFRTVDPAEFGGGDAPRRSISRR